MITLPTSSYNFDVFSKTDISETVSIHTMDYLIIICRKTSGQDLKKGKNLLAIAAINGHLEI